MQGETMAAPFVMKTYKLVNDSSTDAVICWGKESNSLVVADPFAFSRTLLPAHFKHNNFSSFVRQLNTYGFRKVDPDRWEFAHAFFLKGQTHLLRQVVRRNTNNSINPNKKIKEEAVDEIDDSVVFEVLKLKQEQKSIDEKVERMSRQLQETERKPKKMIAFLLKVAGDTQLLQRLTEKSDEEEEGNGIKRARLMLELDNEGNIDDMLALDCDGLVDGGEESAVLGDDQFVPSVGPMDFDAVNVFGMDRADLIPLW